VVGGGGWGEVGVVVVVGGGGGGGGGGRRRAATIISHRGLGWLAARVPTNEGKEGLEVEEIVKKINQNEKFKRRK